MDGVGHGHTDSGELTGVEREVLQTALDRGYFEVPRRVSTVALAEDHGVSTREFGEHLRRGMSKVLREGL